MNTEVGSFLERATMMDQAQCLERAAECLQAAQSSPEADAQMAWRRLSETWTAWSKTIVRLRDPEQVSFPRIRPNPSVKALNAIFDLPFGLTNTASGRQAGATSPSVRSGDRFPLTTGALAAQRDLKAYPQKGNARSPAETQHIVV